MNDPTYAVYSIPTIPGQHHIVQYKDLRLQALQIDPQSFSSTYERELSMTYDQWRARLQSRDKATIIATASFQSSERLSWQHKWVGMITVLGPKVLKQFGFTVPQSVQGGSYYAFMGIWIHPNHRGKGLGRRLISAGMDWTQADDETSPSEEKRTLLIQVLKDNKPAIGLYSSMGFYFIGPDEGKENDNTIWMGMRLDH